MNTEPNDSRPDTLAHIERVQTLLQTAINNLSRRACDHDASKLLEPEKAAFDRLKKLSLSGMAYGSEEYRACLRAEKPAIEHHYAWNSHHPEFYPQLKLDDKHPLIGLVEGYKVFVSDNGRILDVDTKVEQYAAQLRAAEESSVNGMSLFDLMEMLLDWKAATERMQNGGDIRASLAHNVGRFGLSSQLTSILSNTIREMGW